MRKALIEECVQKLSVSLGGVKPPIPENELRRFYEKNDLTGMIKTIARLLRLQNPIIIRDITEEMKRNKDALIKLIASVTIPGSMAPYGTRAFGVMPIELFFNRAYLKIAPFEGIVFTIAHELCHVILHSIGHELKKSEMATDLAAMILGFRNFYRIGSRYVDLPACFPYKEKVRKALLSINKIFEITIFTERRSVYLTPEEVCYATDLMEQMEKTKK